MKTVSFQMKLLRGLGMTAFFVLGAAFLTAGFNVATEGWNALFKKIVISEIIIGGIVGLSIAVSIIIFRFFVGILKRCKFDLGTLNLNSVTLVDNAGIYLLKIFVGIFLICLCLVIGYIVLLSGLIVFFGPPVI